MSTDLNANPALRDLPFALGDLIAEKYQVERVLGVGGMGVVLAAKHLDLDRMVAVKVIRRELAKSEESVQRLMLEARAAARIRSEHVGKVLDVGRLPEGEPYIVMEYLDGYDLATYLERKGRLGVVESIELLLQACEALNEAHDAAIVHRDLKPENLFLTPQNDGSHHLKVLDFGISKHLGDTGARALTTPQTAVGSPQYMAPEQMQAEAVDTRADVWALGAILYEMLTGGPAFGGDTLPAVCARVLSSTPQPLRELAPNVPIAVEAIVNACLQKNRTQRLADVRTLVGALAPFGGAQAQVLQGRILGQAHGQTQKLELSPVTAKPLKTLDGEPVPASRTVTVNRSLQRGPIYWVMGGVVVVGIFLLWLNRSTPMRTRPPEPDPSLRAELVPSAPPPSAPALAALSAPAVLNTSTADELVPTASGLQAVSSGASNDPSATTPSAAAPSAQTPAPVSARRLPTSVGANVKRGTSTVAPSPATAASRRATEAWDPNSFGGRH